ncbi:MAG: hypothetical protein KY464_12205 [Gemmatimonadetes bacterium]|nr:hypothetical protein [Gemmatimonadota bacterium]
MRWCEKRLVRLKALPTSTAPEGMPVLHGWEVFAAVGRVEDLVLNPRSLKARYLDIALDEDLTRAVAHEPHILVPVGDARVGMEPRRVYLDGFDREGVAEVPAYLRMPPVPEVELAVRRPFEPHLSGTAFDSDFFDSELCGQARFLEARG